MKTLNFVTGGREICQRHDPEALRDHICTDCLLEVITKHEIRSLKSLMTGGPINHFFAALGTSGKTSLGNSRQPEPVNL